MQGYEKTRFWVESLAARSSDPNEHQRANLRSTFIKFRERAKTLAAEIASSLPEFTVHDISHIDALWEMAELAGGDAIHLTPTEAFVLGGAFLTHDLGMGLAAYPLGLADLEALPEWKDAAIVTVMKQLGYYPTATDLSRLDEVQRKQITAHVLRRRHAERAEELLSAFWKDTATGEPYYLIEDHELRTVYGSLIGRIAYSHWWSVDRLRDEFRIVLNPPPGFPGDWTVDPLKLACLLRVADAIHLDTRRAPGFLRALRAPGTGAHEHWLFQQHLQLPSSSNAVGRVIFTSTHAFSSNESQAWWLCYDTLRMADRELRQVDRLLSDLGRQSFAVHGVQNIESPALLAELIRTKDWLPIDAHIGVARAAELIRTLGGTGLYGDDPVVPLRELIQNGADAVRARRALERRGESWGDIFVRLGQEDGIPWIEVEDTGIGMSEHVLMNYLLSFGNSYWGSEEMLSDTPGLFANGFKPIGQYGIGFFSVFMWGDQVRVTTRKCSEAPRDTYLLELGSDVTLRPLVRRASQHERMYEGGTKVRVRLRAPLSETIRWGRRDAQGRLQMDILCAELCPSLDVNLSVELPEGPMVRVITANDWISMDGLTLRTRIEDVYVSEHPMKGVTENLRPIVDDNGHILGRVAVNPRMNPGRSGVVTAGGIRVFRLHGVSGVLLGRSLKVARDAAVLFANEQSLAAWASEQADLLQGISYGPQAVKAAAVIRAYCGDLKGSIAALAGSDWLSLEQIVERYARRDEISIFSHDAYLSDNQQPFLSGSLITAEPLADFQPPRQDGPVREVQYTSTFLKREEPPLYHTLLHAIIEAISSDWAVPVDAVFSNSFIEYADAAGNTRHVSLDTVEVQNLALPVYHCFVRKPSA